MFSPSLNRYAWIAKLRNCGIAKFKPAQTNFAVSHFRSFAIAIALVTLASTGALGAELKVCADPDNLPFSNRQQQGFENRVAELLSRELHANITYEWQRLGRGFVREVLNKGKCDVVLGIPQNFRGMLTTAPYYRSDYVFVVRRDRGLHFASFDDPQLRHMKIGVQVLDEEYAPPAEALGRRGLIGNVVGFDSTGDDADSIIRAVLHKKVDAAIVWGPLAGYYARAHRGELELTPVPQFDSALPMAFSISMGVSRSNIKLRDQLDAVIERRRPEIERILRSYGVPMLPASATAKGGS